MSFIIKIGPQASTYVEPVRDGSDGEQDEDSDEEYDDDAEDEEDEEYDDDTASQQAGIFVELKFTLPSNYPDEKPSIELLDSQNLNELELERVMNIISKRTNQSVGTVMVFKILCDVIEWMITKHEREVNELEVERERKQRELEAEETKKIIGTPVTEQSFLAWKARFDAEMIKLKLEQQKQQLVEQTGGAKRLTGREMFESDKTLAESDLNFVEDLDQNQIEALLQDVDLEGEDFDEEIDSGDEEDEELDDDSEFEDEE